MSLSVIVHLSVPSGDCIVAVPLDCVLSTCPTSLCFPRACWKVITQPWTFTVAIPVYVVPLQQNLNSPVTEFNNNTVFGLLSSWMQTSNWSTVQRSLRTRVTARMQCAPGSNRGCPDTSSRARVNLRRCR